jgi:serine/threonine protein kinase
MNDSPTQAIPAGGPPERVIADRYRLSSLLGRGGTADVWRADDEALDRTVALKLVTVPTDEGAARAGDEARTLAKLSHPCLVPVYDAGTDDQGRPWVVMELVEGETLSETLKRGPVPSQRAATIGRSIAEALGYVHTQGLVHRDVKPGNILIGNDGRVRLTDFGIARLVDAAKVTSTGMMIGTASYLAPEQVAGEPVGPPADVYALGLVLLECLTGEREYAGGTVEVALARLQRSPNVPASLPDGWPGLLQAMTHRDPARRPTPQQVAADLRRIEDGSDATTVLAAGRPPRADATQVLPRTAAAPRAAAAYTEHVPRAPRPAPPRQPPPSSSNGWVWALLLVVIVAAIAIGAVLYDQNAADDTPRELPPIDAELPQPLRDNLQRLQEEARS